MYQMSGGMITATEKATESISNKQRNPSSLTWCLLQRVIPTANRFISVCKRSFKELWLYCSTNYFGTRYGHSGLLRLKGYIPLLSKKTHFFW